MPIFKYDGIDSDGKRIHSTQQAEDSQDLKRILKGRKITIRSYTQLKEKRTSDFLAVSSKVKKSEFVSFCKQFAIMLKAGVSIAECLNTLRKQKFSTIFKNNISKAYEEVLKGSLLSEAFKKSSKNFPEFFCSMVYVGELSGNLSQVLVKAADYYDNDLKIKSKTKSAMIYPIFLIVIVIAIFFLLMIVVVPEFKSTLEQEGVELPGLTRGVMAISDFIIDNWLILLVSIGAFIFLCYLFFRKTNYGKYIASYVAFHLPILKTIKMNSLTTRFGMSFSILLQSGMQVIDAMKAMPKIINNKYFEKKFAYAIEEVNNGKRLSRALESTQLFPPMLIQMVTVGENTSSLDEVLDIVGDYYNSVLATSIQRATSMLEPVAIILLGIVVLVIILSVMLPMFSMVNNVY